MVVQLDHQDFVNLVASLAPSAAQCCALQGLGYMDFTGNQHNEDWVWKKSSLSLLGDKQLFDLYRQLKNG